MIDLKDAFPSVDGKRLAFVLSALYPSLLGFEEEIHAFLAKYFLAPEGGIYLGGPASSDLFNLYVGALIDNPLRELCWERGVIYTRYVDDLTFSVPDLSSFRLDSRIARKRIREIVWRAGFQVNPQKAEFTDLKKRPVVVTGIGIRSGGELFLPRPYLRKIRAVMRRQETHGDVVPWSDISSSAWGLYRTPVDPEVGDDVVAGMVNVFLTITEERIRTRRLDAVEQKLLHAWQRFQDSSRKRQG